MMPVPLPVFENDAKVAGSSSSDDAEDHRDHTRRVQLQRHVNEVCALEHLIADLALGVLDQQPALRTFEEDDDQQ